MGKKEKNKNQELEVKNTLNKNNYDHENKDFIYRPMTRPD